MMTIPSELTRSTPRNVALSGGGRAATIAMIVIFAAALPLGAWLAAMALEATARERVALPAPGRIVALSSTRGEHPRWVARYMYPAAGRLLSGSSRLGRVDRERVAVGDPIAVRYLPDDPQQSWVAGRQPGALPIWLAPLAAMGLFVAIPFRRQHALLANGRPAVARVIAQRRGPKNTQVMTVEFMTLSGAKVTRKLEATRQGAPVGSEIVVLYDPDNPARSARYPLGLFTSQK